MSADNSDGLRPVIPILPLTMVGGLTGSDFHTGIDISGANIYGTPVVASNSGKVVFVNTSYTPGKGYGKYLIVDHGGGYTTLYAHNSEIVVNVGDYVTRGQTIAKVGSTGWSTYRIFILKSGLTANTQTRWNTCDSRYDVTSRAKIGENR